MVASAIFSGCALDAVPPPVYAELMVVNAIPAASSTVPLVAGNAPRLEINVDGVDLLADSMQSSSFRGYFALQPGTRNVRLTAANAHPAAGITLGQQFHSYTFNGEANKFASTFLFTENGAITSITVNDNLATPDTNRVHVRVVNLTANPIDVFRTTTGTVNGALVTSTPESTFTNVASKTASNFVPIRSVPLRPGNALPTFVRQNYSFQIRAVGATTNLVTLAPPPVSATLNPNANANTATLENQRIYTIVVRPGATPTAAPVVFGFFNNRI